MNKKEAADFLGCSSRQLERYVKENQIGVRYEKGRTRPTPVFDEAELQRFKEAQERPVYKPSIARASTMATPNDNSDDALSLLPQPAQMDALARLFEAFTAPAAQAQEKPSVPIADKLLLTLDECQTLTSLSRATLRSAIDDGALKAQVIGRGFKIKRSDLDKYIAKL